MNKHLFPYHWNLKDGYIESNGLNVFGTFICGGGSTMGYKLAGFNHLGGVEIDAKLADVYKTNHNPKYFYLQDIREFNKRTDLPDELYHLDILDGSPPCSSFSMAGNREKDWGKQKKFKEGQSNQTLDDLVFVYCDTIIKLQPKVFILENVKGIIQGNAKSYSKRIVKKMTDAGYNVQVFLLNAATMGVPQKRERIFFIGHKKELKLPKLKMQFNEKAIWFGEIKTKDNQYPLNETMKRYWDKRIKTDIDISNIAGRLDNRPNSFFNHKFLKDNEVANTITRGDLCTLYSDPRYRNNEELCLCGTYPLDYDFKGIDPKYLIGMSVPPVMIAQIATKIKEQWLTKLYT